MLIIDTNVLYYASGLSEHHSIDSNTIKKAIAASDRVAVSSISLAEFITKYHKHAGTIRRVCSFMRQNHIGISANQYIPFQDDIIKKLRVIKQKDLNDIYKKLLIIKCDTESRFATVVFFTVLVSETIFECNIDPYSVPTCIFDFFSTVFKDSLRPVLTDLFKYSYQNAYKTDDAENAIRQVFYDYLKLFISLCAPLCKHVIDEYNNIPEGDIVDIPDIISRYSDTNWSNEMTSLQKKIEKQATPAHFVKSKGLQYGKGINDKHLSGLLAGLESSFKKTIGMSSIEEYLYAIVSNTISNGGAFRKNDINDALILSDLKPTDLILTFDTRMIEHLGKHSDSKKEYKNSISLINSIRNFPSV